MDSRFVFVALLALSGAALARRPLQVADVAAPVPAAEPQGEEAAAQSPLEAAAGPIAIPDENSSGGGAGAMMAGETPAAAPMMMEAETPAAAPMMMEAETPAAAPMMMEAETPAAAPMMMEAETPAAAPMMMEAETPVMMEAETPAEAPMMMEAETPAEAPGMDADEVAPAIAPAAYTVGEEPEVATAPTPAAMPEMEAAEPSMAAAAPMGAAISAGDVPAMEAPASAPSADATAAAAPGPMGAEKERSANLLFTMSAKRVTVTKTGILLEGVSPVVSYVSDVPARHAGRFNTSFFTSQAFADNGTWLSNPDAVLMGVVTAGGTDETNGTVGTVVLKLSNPVYNATRYTLRFDSEIQTPDQNALTLQNGNANYQIDEAGDKLMDITDRTVFMDNLLFLDAYAQAEKAAKGGAKSSILGGGYCNPLGSLTSFGCEAFYGTDGLYYGGATLGR